MKTLVVDDDHVSLKIIEKLLAKHGHHVTSCFDADSGWQAFQKDHYPLVILDWLLPQSSGLELCRRMRASPRGSRCVIIIITSCNEPGDLHKVLEAGADDYLTKPVDLNLFGVRLVIAERRTRDIEERRHLEETVLGISTDEKERIGQDLHDTLGQSLTGIGFLARALEKKLEDKSVPESLEIKKLRELVDKSIKQTHQMAKGLFPVDMMSGGLYAAINDLADMIKSLYNISCTFKYDKVVEVQNHQQAGQLYRIVQEAVNNSVKHANASKISIEAIVDDEDFILVVSDNGIGITTNSDRHGMGLSIMQYRARCIGATVDIGQQPGGGTQMKCRYNTRDSLQKAG